MSDSLQCSNKLREAGRPYPRTCFVCSLGPCRYSTSVRPPVPDHSRAITVSEKHLNLALEIANGREILALTIAQALAAAEREGREGERKRCAEIARRDADWSRFGKKEVHEPWEGGPDGARDYRIGIVTGRAIAAAILSEIGEA